MKKVWKEAMKEADLQQSTAQITKMYEKKKKGGRKVGGLNSPFDSVDFKSCRKKSSKTKAMKEKRKSVDRTQIPRPWRRGKKKKKKKRTKILIP